MPPNSWVYGSNWKVTTAIGTVAMSVANVALSACRHLGCRRTTRGGPPPDIIGRNGESDAGCPSPGPIRGGGVWGPVHTRSARPVRGGEDRTCDRLIGTTMATVIPCPSVRLRVDLLGRLDARTADGRPIRLTGRHAQALFALLVLARRPRSREAIAADLWPDADGTSAGSLRQALWLVRQGLADAGFGAGAVLDIEADTVGIRLDATIDLDVDQFEAMTTDAQGAEAAVDLYHGDLLEGLGHECFATERERLSDRFEDALAIVAERRLAAGDPAGAQAAAERLLERDPLREEAHAVLIAVHGLIGSRSQVIRQYRRLSVVLAARARRAAAPRHRGDLSPRPGTHDGAGAGTGRAPRSRVDVAGPARRRRLTRPSRTRRTRRTRNDPGGAGGRRPEGRPASRVYWRWMVIGTDSAFGARRRSELQLADVVLSGGHRLRERRRGGSPRSRPARRRSGCRSPSSRCPGRRRW